MNWLIVFLAKYLVFVIVIAFVYLWYKAPRTDKLKILVAFVVAGITAAVVAKLASKLYYDPRPFITHHVKPLVAHSADNGFPSEHTTLAATLSVLIFFYWRRWALIATILTLAVGTGRVLAHVHSPIDIAGGILIGCLAGFVGHYASPKLLLLRKRD